MIAGAEPVTRFV